MPPFIAAPRRTRLAFVVTSLRLGGAELMLWKLLSRIDRDAFDASVFALADGDLNDLFRSIDVPCHVVGMKPARRAATALARLAFALRRARPDVVQGWLYHGNIAASVANALSGVRTPVLWNIRGALAAEEKPLTKLVIATSGMLTRLPVKIIYNSTATAAEHERRLGYRADKRVVLPNGFDTDAFRPSDAARAELRRSLGFSRDEVLIGTVGRYHAVKGHDYFLRAAAIISAKHPSARYLLIGEDLDATNTRIAALVEELGLRDRVRLLGLRRDMPHVTAALDVSVLASTAEGFPNAVGEAMSCGVPCVVTDVGDCAWLVGNTGRSVSPRDPPSLANAVNELISIGRDGRRELGERGRQRIVDNFSLPSVVRQYEELYAHMHISRARADVRAPLNVPESKHEQP